MKIRDNSLISISSFTNEENDKYYYNYRFSTYSNVILVVLSIILIYFNIKFIGQILLCVVVYNIISFKKLILIRNDNKWKVIYSKYLFNFCIKKEDYIFGNIIEIHSETSRQDSDVYIKEIYITDGQKECVLKGLDLSDSMLQRMKYFLSDNPNILIVKDNYKDKWTGNFLNNLR